MADRVVDQIDTAQLLPADRAEVARGEQLYRVRDANDKVVTLRRLVRLWADGFNYAVAVPIASNTSTASTLLAPRYFLPFPKWPALSMVPGGFLKREQLISWADTLSNASAAVSDAVTQQQYRYVADLMRALYANTPEDADVKAIVAESGQEARKAVQKRAQDWWLSLTPDNNGNGGELIVNSADDREFHAQIEQALAAPNRVRDALVQDKLWFTGDRWERWNSDQLGSSDQQQQQQQQQHSLQNSPNEILLNVGSRLRLELPLFGTNSQRLDAVDSFLDSAMALFRRFSLSDIAAIDQYYLQTSLQNNASLRSLRYDGTRPPPLPGTRAIVTDSSSDGGGVFTSSNSQAALKVLLETWRLYSVGLRTYDDNSAANINALDKELSDTEAFRWLRSSSSLLPRRAGTIDQLERDYSAWYYSLVSETERVTENVYGDNAAVYAGAPRSVWLYASDEWTVADMHGWSRAAVLRDAARFVASQAKARFVQWLTSVGFDVASEAGASLTVSQVLEIVRKETPFALAQRLGLATRMERCAPGTTNPTSDPVVVGNVVERKQKEIVWSWGPYSTPVLTNAAWAVESKQPINVDQYTRYSPMAVDNDGAPFCLVDGASAPRFFVVQNVPLIAYYRVRPTEVLFSSTGAKYRLFAVNYGPSFAQKDLTNNVLWPYAVAVRDGSEEMRLQWYVASGHGGFSNAVPHPAYVDEHRAELLWYEQIDE